jgi:predicted esterase
MFPIAAVVCSLVTQNCPRDQMCVGDWDQKTRVCSSTGRCVARPAPIDVELWLPVAAGEHLDCGKGNLAHDTSHNACGESTRFAFDLVSSAFDAPHIIVAAADGVAHIRGGCATLDINDPSNGNDPCNSGWGNYVRIQHTADAYTQYAHLSSILVHDGDRVQRGQPIGVEGNTGLAGAKHLHFSAHRGNAARGGPSVPFTRMRVATRTLASDEIVCGDWSHGKPVTPTMRLVSETPVVAQPVTYGFRAAPTAQPRHCAFGMMRLGEVCFSIPPSSTKGVVLFLHGLYKPEGTDEELRVEANLAREASQRGLALVAPRGKIGLCDWPEARGAYCWPSSMGQASAAAAIGAELKPVLAEIDQLTGATRHSVIGFSNGGYFAAMLVGEVDAAAILHGGLPVGDYKLGKRAVPTLLIAAENDPWQLPKMRELDAAMTRAGWTHELRMRAGNHELSAEDIRAALDFVAK